MNLRSSDSHVWEQTDNQLIKIGVQKVDALSAPHILSMLFCANCDQRTAEDLGDSSICDSGCPISSKEDEVAWKCGLILILD